MNGLQTHKSCGKRGREEKGRIKQQSNFAIQIDVDKRRVLACLTGRISANSFAAFFSILLALFSCGCNVFRGLHCTTEACQTQSFPRTMCEFCCASLLWGLFCCCDVMECVSTFHIQWVFTWHRSQPTANGKQFRSLR